MSWQDTIAEASVEDEELLSSQSSLQISRAYIVDQSQLATDYATAQKQSSKNFQKQTSSSQSKLIVPKSISSQKAKSCKHRNKAAGGGAQAQTRLSSAFKATTIPSFSRLSGQSICLRTGGPNNTGAQTTTNANRKSMQTTACHTRSNTDTGQALGGMLQHHGSTTHSRTLSATITQNTAKSSILLNSSSTRKSSRKPST